MNISSFSPQSISSSSTRKRKREEEEEVGPTKKTLVEKGLVLTKDFPSEIVAHIFGFAGLPVSTLDLYQKDPEIKEIVYFDMLSTLDRCDGLIPLHLKESYQAQTYQAKVLGAIQLINNEVARYPDGQNKFEGIRKQHDPIYSPQALAKLQELNQWSQEERDKSLITFFKALSDANDLISLEVDLETDQQIPAQLASKIRKWLISNKEILEKVEELDLSSQDLTSLPSEIKYFKNLLILNLDSNQLESLPPEIGCLTQLKEFSLNSNKLENLPPEIGYLNLLTKLSLYSNQLTGLPPETRYLTQLEELGLNSNKLENLPPEIGDLTQLKYLFISLNKLKCLHPKIGNLTQLRVLCLEFNALENLPPEIGNLNQLRVLRLELNALANLPPEIGNLTQLEELSISSNKLKCLPPEISKLAKLNSVDM